MASAGPYASLHLGNHASTHQSVFSCRPTNSVKALKALKVQKRKTKMCKQTCSEASVTVTSTAVCVCVFQLIKHWELFLPEAKSVVWTAALSITVVSRISVNVAALFPLSRPMPKHTSLNFRPKWVTIQIEILLYGVYTAASLSQWES